MPPQASSRVRNERPRKDVARTVLFADPDPQVVRALQALFRTDPRLTVLTASTVDDALELLETEAIDLLVAERMLAPGRETDLLHEAVRRKPDLPVLVLTDLKPDQHVIVRDQIGPERVILQKPWDSDELRRTIHEHVSPEEPKTTRPWWIPSFNTLD